MPGYLTSSSADSPPSARPSSAAYTGAVKGDHSFFRTVAKATTSPPIAPSMIQGAAHLAPDPRGRQDHQKEKKRRLVDRSFQRHGRRRGIAPQVGEGTGVQGGVGCADEGHGKIGRASC